MKLKHIDYAELCKLVSEHKTADYIANHFGVCGRVIRRRVKLFGLKLTPTRFPTDETRQKISSSRKKYLSENPDKHPWRNHNKFKSEPCEKVKAWLRSNSVPFSEEYQPLLNAKKNYSIDIAFPDRLIGIEVNGNQHYESNGKLKPYYQARQTEIESAGWKLYQVHYSLCYTPSVLSNIISTILSADTKVEFNYSASKPVVKPKVSKSDQMWRHRPRIYARKVARPSKEELEILIQSTPMTIIGKRFGVSDNAVRKWCKWYGILR